MTVLQRNAATGVDLGQLGKSFAKAVVIGAIGAGVALGITSDGVAESQSTQAARLQEQFFAEANALNKADGIGVPEAAFTNKADVVLRQRGAELAGASSAAQPTSSVAGLELADKIEGYPSQSTSTKPESKPATSRNFGTQTAK